VKTPPPFARAVIAVLLIAAFVGALFALVFHATSATPDDAGYFSRFGILAVGVLWLIAVVLAGDVNPFALAMGADNRLSTSKLQALLWTACVGFVYATIYADRAFAHGLVSPITNIPQNVLIALGVSVTSAVAAKAITTSKVAANPDHKDVQATPNYDPAALVRDDGAQTASLTKVQVLFWTIVAIVVYITSALHGLHDVASCKVDCSFPDIDTSLMIFMGLGHATYLGGKLAGGSTPQLSGAVTASDGDVVVTGSSLGSGGCVLVNGAALDDDLVDTWSTTSVKFTLPSACNAPGTRVAVAVAPVPGNTASPPVTYVVPGATPGPASPPTTPPNGTTTSSSTTNGAATPSGTTTTSPPKPPQPASPPKPSPPPAAVRRPIGIDVSYAQAQTIDWDTVKRDGLADFVYARASYGTNPAYDDPNFVRNHDACKRLGIPFGAYHFFLFSQPGAEQAAHFIERVRDYHGTLCPAVDVEAQSGSGASTAEMIQNLGAFTSAVERALGVRMLIYTNQSAWNAMLGGTDAFGGHPLWVANVTNDPDVPPAMPSGFGEYALHQFSFTGKLPHIDGTFGSVDMNVARATLEPITIGGGAIAVAVNPSPPQPPTKPAPPPASAALHHVVYDGVDKKLKGFAADASIVFAIDARNDSVASNAWRPDAGCPPGTYTLAAPESNDPNQASVADNDWVAEGLWFIPLTGIPGHDGIGIHGGGTCRTPPAQAALAARQGWCPTENCFRVQNEDLAMLAKLPLAGKTIEVVQPA